MRSLNLDQLKTLTEVILLGSFSAAARRLNLTQPAVSLQIRELERRFGVRLVERLGKQAHPTAPGRELINAAQRIFHECDAANAVMRRFRDGWVGRVFVGTTLTAMIYRLPPLLRKVRLDNPGIDLMVANTPTSSSVEKIIGNQLDLALVTLPVEKRQLRITPLLSEMMVAILPAGTQNVPKEITPVYAAGQTMLVEQTSSAGHGVVTGWLSGQLPGPREPMPLGTVEALKSAVASNLGMAIVPEVAIDAHRSDFIVRPLRPAILRTLALVEHKHKPNAPAIEIVRNALLTLRDSSGSAPHARRKLRVDRSRTD